MKMTQHLKNVHIFEITRNQHALMHFINLRRYATKKSTSVNIKKLKRHLQPINFMPYFSSKDVNRLLASGELFQGSLRVVNRNDSFVTGLEREEDYYVDGLQSRNRALPDDIVALKLMPESKWRTYTTYPSGILRETPRVRETYEVVSILEKRHPRIFSGFIKPVKSNRHKIVMMQPLDERLPIVMLPSNQVPPEFHKRPQDFETTLFLAKITDWNEETYFASGKLIKKLGNAGCIDAETEAILSNNCIDRSPFSRKILQTLPSSKNWKITSDELKKRVDLRSECIFSIDPATARDLDDALSCKPIGENLFEVGVHIADVSHFVAENSPLDEVAMERGNSVYLSQKVIPMLPEVLSEELCSLNPGVDRLAFSAMWHMNSAGEISKTWFQKSVIKSCCKLTYNDAQQLLETPLGDDLNPKEFPEVCENFLLEQIHNILNVLSDITKTLRKKRFISGAISYTLPEISFTLDGERGEPIGVDIKDYQDSNKLIEELMLLANISVAHKIYMSHPEKAILRCHPPPNPNMMKDLVRLCELYEVPFDATSGKTINKSFDKITKLPDEQKSLLEPALSLLCTKPSLLAQYFCAGHVKDEKLFHHYGLNVPLYTHFTSPIRRYPDILVHRALAAALESEKDLLRDSTDLQKIADNSNNKKLAAKKASEQSSLLFLALFLSNGGPLREKGVVMSVTQRYFDVLCTRFGIVKRVYCEDLHLVSFSYAFEDSSKPKLTLKWKNKNDKNEVEEQTIIMFAPVEAVLSVNEKKPSEIHASISSPFDVTQCS